MVHADLHGDRLDLLVQQEVLFLADTQLLHVVVQLDSRGCVVLVEVLDLHLELLLDISEHLVCLASDETKDCLQGFFLSHPVTNVILNLVDRYQEADSLQRVLHFLLVEYLVKIQVQLFLVCQLLEQVFLLPVKLQDHVTLLGTKLVLQQVSRVLLHLLNRLQEPLPKIADFVFLLVDQLFQMCDFSFCLAADLLKLIL